MRMNNLTRLYNNLIEPYIQDKYLSGLDSVDHFPKYSKVGVRKEKSLARKTI
jgi:hypothetical protein